MGTHNLFSYIFRGSVIHTDNIHTINTLVVLSVVNNIAHDMPAYNGVYTSSMPV